MRGALLALVACGRVAFDARQVPDATGAPCSFGPWSAPTRIAELASAQDDWGGQIAPDDLTFYYNVANRIFVATRPDRSSPFGIPTELPELGTQMYDPTVSADGLEMYLDGAPSGPYAVYRSTRAAITGAWGPPQLLFASADGPFLSIDGLRLYYTTVVGPAVVGQIAMSTRASITDAFTPGTPVAGLAGGDQGSPSLAADEREIFFEVQGATFDVQTATRASTADPFGPATAMSIDSPQQDSDVSISPDGTELIFASNRPGGAGGDDLYVATRSCF